MPRPPVLLGAYAAVAVVHVVAWMTSTTVVATTTKPLLMPLLALFLLSATPRPLPRMVRVVLAALAFSWLGDVLLEAERLVDSEGLFLAGLGGFFVAQVLYIVAFTPIVRSSTPPRPPIWALGYVVYGAILVGYLGPDLGVFLLPVGLYAVAICLMGIVASGVNAWTAVGAAAFVLSDSLITAGEITEVLTLGDNWQRVLVMSTYTLAQALLVIGVVVAQGGSWRTSPTASSNSPSSPPASA